MLYAVLSGNLVLKFVETCNWSLYTYSAKGKTFVMVDPRWECTPSSLSESDSLILSRNHYSEQGLCFCWRP